MEYRRLVRMGNGTDGFRVAHHTTDYAWAGMRLGAESNMLASGCPRNPGRKAPLTTADGSAVCPRGRQIRARLEAEFQAVEVTSGDRVSGGNGTKDARIGSEGTRMVAIG